VSRQSVPMYATHPQLTQTSLNGFPVSKNYPNTWLYKCSSVNKTAQNPLFVLPDPTEINLLINMGVNIYQARLSTSYMACISFCACLMLKNNSEYASLFVY